MRYRTGKNELQEKSSWMSDHILWVYLEYLSYAEPPQSELQILNIWKMFYPDLWVAEY